MPYAEPYFVRTSGPRSTDLDAACGRPAEFCAQESRHQGEHRRFNDRWPRPTGDGPARGWIDRTYGGGAAPRSRRFSLAFAAASETIAYSIARWADRHPRAVRRRRPEATVALFQWHLAEEVEHKSVAFDVYQAVDGSRWRQAVAAFTTFTILAWFTVLTLMALLVGSGRWRSVGCWLRLPRWAFGIAFRTIPDLVVSCLPGPPPRPGHPGRAGGVAARRGQRRRSHRAEVNDISGSPEAATVRRRSASTSNGPPGPREAHPEDGTGEAMDVAFGRRPGPHDHAGCRWGTRRWPRRRHRRRPPRPIPRQPVWRPRPRSRSPPRRPPPSPAARCPSVSGC